MAIAALLAVFFVLLFRSSTSQSCDYNSAYGCAYENTINISYAGNAIDEPLLGYFGAAFADTVTARYGLSVMGSFGCFMVDTLNATVDQYISGQIPINCQGLFSCAGINHLINNKSEIICDGEKSCASSNLYAGSEDNNGVVCNGYRSCQNSIIRSTLNIQLSGTLAGLNATLISTESPRVFTFSGPYSGYNARIICGDGAVNVDYTCIISCHATGCNNITQIDCNIINGSCAFYVHCQSAMKSYLCPDGSQSPFLSNFEDFLDIPISTVDESISTCNDSNLNTNVVNCGCSGVVVDNPGPVCCSGGLSCRNTTKIAGGINSSRVWRR